MTLRVAECFVGKEYLDSLAKAVEIRKNKRTIYHDEFLNDSVEFLMLTIENKLKRIKMHIKNSTITNDVEKCEDNILDAVNYLLFLNCVINKKCQRK